MIDWPEGIIPDRYSKRYEKLIENAKSRIFPKNEYGEVHHVIPKCFGGKNSSDNMVKLFAREHYLAHLLLWKMNMSPKMHNKMSMALHVMVNGSGNKKQDRSYLIPARIYEQSRKAYVIAIKEHFAEHGVPFKGKKHTLESIQKIIDANVRTKDIRSAKLSGEGNGMFGKEHSIEVKKVISEGVIKSFDDERKDAYSKRLTEKWADPEYKQQMLELRKTSEGWLNRDWKAISAKTRAGRIANGTNNHTEESKSKISETRKAKFASGEIIPWNKGRKLIGPSKSSKTWEITKPNGEVDIFIGNIRNYCADNNIGYDSFRDLANGKKGNNKLFRLGWGARILDNKSKQQYTYSMKYALIDTANTFFRARHIASRNSDACEKNWIKKVDF